MTKEVTFDSILVPCLYCRTYNQKIFYDSRPHCRRTGGIGSIVHPGNLLFPGNGRSVPRRAWTSNSAAFDPCCCPFACPHSSRNQGLVQLFFSRPYGERIPLGYVTRRRRVRIMQPQHENTGYSSLLILV